MRDYVDVTIRHPRAAKYLQRPSAVDGSAAAVAEDSASPGIVNSVAIDGEGKSDTELGPGTQEAELYWAEWAPLPGDEYQ